MDKFNSTAFKTSCLRVCLYIIVLSSFLSQHAIAQETRQFGLYGGLNVGKFLAPEIGVFKRTVDESEFGPMASTTLNLGMEMYNPGSSWQFAPKIQARGRFFFFELSGSLLYYSNWQDIHKLRFRPEFGVSWLYWDIAYAVNIGRHNFTPNANGNSLSIPSHMLTLRGYLSIKPKRKTNPPYQLPDQTVDKITLAPIHDTLDNIKHSLMVLRTHKFIVRVDQLNDQSYRYASWSSGKKMIDRPDLILTNGVYEFKDNEGFVYTFKNGKHTFRATRNYPVDGQGKIIVTLKNKVILEETGSVTREPYGSRD